MALIDKETIRAEIERRMFEDYNGPDTEQNETAQGVCAGILAFLDTLKETPTWVIRAEQRKKDQASGKKFAIMEIRAELEWRRDFYLGQANACIGTNIVDGLDEALSFLDTLPDEPKLPKWKWVDPKYEYPPCVTREMDENGDWRYSLSSGRLYEMCQYISLAELSLKLPDEPVDKPVDVKPEQPAEGLEEEIENFFNNLCNADEYGQVVMDKSRGYLCANVDDCKDIARHFYELGCTRTAVMYDDIEYERQRAEEAEPSGDLEEEVKRYWNWVTGFQPSFAVLELKRDDLTKIARHFAEWGAEQKAIEIFKKQNCRGCGTQRCTGEGEWLEGCREFQKWREEYLK